MSSEAGGIGNKPRPIEPDPISGEALHRELSRMLAGVGPVPDGWESRLSAYLALMREWNERTNLVSRRAASRVVSDQVIPSLAALMLVPAGEPMRVLDIGSGGGFPGIPLAILRPSARIDLVDATRKKVEFLETVIKRLGLATTRAHWCRIEQPGAELERRAPFDLAFARAVGHASKLARGARPLVREGGALWAFVAPPTPGAIPWPPDRPTTALLRIELTE